MRQGVGEGADRAGPGRVRRVAFFAWATLLALLLGLTFIGLTAFTIGRWLAGQNPSTTPVGDLSFFALGEIVVGVGFAVQLRAPERHVAGMQQALVGLLCLAVAGLLGARAEPLVGGALFLLAASPLVALHPARRKVFALRSVQSVALAAMSILAAIPAVGYAASMLVLARPARPSCFLGRCAYGDRFAEMAAAAISIVLIGLLATLNGPGWRQTA